MENETIFTICPFLYQTSSMKIASKVQKHRFKFKFDAGTSRGVLKEKDAWFLALRFEGKPSVTGWGEIAPILGLSKENEHQVERDLHMTLAGIEQVSWPESLNEALETVYKCSFYKDACSSVRMGLEMAFRDLYQGGERLIFDNAFYRNGWEIPINGLIWMGDEAFMQKQVAQKIKEGYRCIKMKIGAIDFEKEIALLSAIRQEFSAADMTLRVDANGAFSPQEAMHKLEKLAKLDLHSIEQPIKAGQWQAMKELCQQSPLPIALDEELIGVHSREEKISLLESIKPPYIILKPSLMGGFQESAEWIQLAEERGISWWNTSALESSLGLNAIAQFTAQYKVNMPQGLGTGQIYDNNFSAPLFIKQGFLSYRFSDQGVWVIKF